MRHFHCPFNLICCNWRQRQRRQSLGWWSCICRPLGSVPWRRQRQRQRQRQWPRSRSRSRKRKRSLMFPMFPLPLSPLSHNRGTQGFKRRWRRRRRIKKAQKQIILILSLILLTPQFLFHDRHKFGGNDGDHRHREYGLPSSLDPEHSSYFCSGRPWI